MVAASVGVFGILLLPWSLTASAALDTPVVTTTTVPLSLGVTFGDPDRLCFGPCDPGNAWINAARYSRQVANQTGQNPLAIRQQMADYALAGVTPGAYATNVLANFGRYVLQPTQLEIPFRGRGHAQDRLDSLITVTTQLIYFPFLAVFVTSLRAVTRRSFEHQLVSILVKLVGAALLLQPFVHVASGRYWPAFAPLFCFVGVAASPDAGTDRPDW